MAAKLATPLFNPLHVPAAQLRNQGWMHLRFGRNAHYFRNNVSLCGRFKIEGKDFRMYGVPSDFREGTDCRACFESDAV